ncbi:TPA: hypothetical protein ACU962_003345, partial [Burkholderia contaminans]
FLVFSGREGRGAPSSPTWITTIAKRLHTRQRCMFSVPACASSASFDIAARARGASSLAHPDPIAGAPPTRAG